MNKLVILGLLLIGCNTQSNLQQATACYSLETCKVTLNGGMEHNNTWPTFNVFCVYGYDAAGNKNGVVERFLSSDSIYAWSHLHPEAKSCTPNFRGD